MPNWQDHLSFEEGYRMGVIKHKIKALRTEYRRIFERAKKRAQRAR